MSKYNRFAKDLDAAFKASRDAYAKAYSQYAQAERAAKDAQRRAPDDTAYTSDPETRRHPRRRTGASRWALSGTSADKPAVRICQTR